MENHFYNMKWAPLNATIFITHVRILRNRSYANALHSYAPDKDIWYFIQG